MFRACWAPGRAMPSSVLWWNGRRACIFSLKSAPVRSVRAARSGFPAGGWSRRDAAILRPAGDGGGAGHPAGAGSIAGHPGFHLQSAGLFAPPRTGGGLFQRTGGPAPFPGRGCGGFHRPAVLLPADPAGMLSLCPGTPGADTFPYEAVGIPRNYPWASGWVEVPVWHYGPHIIWGMTARIVRSLAEA